MTAPEQIDLWRQAPSEHQRLEFKEAKNQFDFGKLQQYCVALANEGGLIKSDASMGKSRKFARYLPFWA